MTRSVVAVVAALALAAFGAAGTRARADDSARSYLNPCAVPNEIGDSIEETAWRIWVAATCPVNADQYPFVVWENWIEQSQLYPADPKNGLKVPNSGAATGTHPLHESPLTLAFNPNIGKTSGLPGAPNTNCNPAAAPPPPNTPPLPSGMCSDATHCLYICEEVRENGATEDYIAGTGLWDRMNQATAAANRFD